MMEIRVLREMPLSASAVAAAQDQTLAAQLSAELSGCFATRAFIQAEVASCAKTVDAASFDPAQAEPGVYYFLTGEVIG